MSLACISGFLSLFLGLALIFTLLCNTFLFGFALELALLLFNLGIDLSLAFLVSLSTLLCTLRRSLSFLLGLLLLGFLLQSELLLLLLLALRRNCLFLHFCFFMSLLSFDSFHFSLMCFLLGNCLQPSFLSCFGIYSLLGLFLSLLRTLIMIIFIFLINLFLLFIIINITCELIQQVISIVVTISRLFISLSI